MTKLVRYLQQHIVGEALEGSSLRAQFATDASPLKLEPLAVVFPNGEQDVRRVARFLWQLAEKGQPVPITARGGGTDFSGASIGPGLSLAFTAHMNRVLSYDSRKDLLEVEAGARLDKLQQVFNVQYRFLPPMPASAQLATIGGAVANNSGGCYSEKYGLMLNYVVGLRVVLANGEVITVKRLSKRGLNRKLGLANFEGQIYRQLDSLLADSKQLVDETADPINVNTGYNLSQVRGRDGSFDLTPLFLGAQGTLGLITRVQLKSAPYNPQPQTILFEFKSMSDCLSATLDLKKLNPAALEMVDSVVLHQVARLSPLALKGIIKDRQSVVLLVEFDDLHKTTLSRKLKRAAAIGKAYATNQQLAKEESEREKLWKVRRSVSYLLADTTHKGRAVPAIENAYVPLERFASFYQDAQKLFKKLQLPLAAWGHIGMGQISVMPKLDLSEVSGRQRLVKLIDGYLQLVRQHGGRLNGCHNAGRLRSHCLAEELGAARAELDMQVKQIVDPYNIFNPDVKVVADKKQVFANLGESYNFSDHYPDLPWF